MNNNFRCYTPYSCNPLQYQKIPIDVYKLPYYDLIPNANGNDNTKVWYKMKDGYIQQYTYSYQDDVNYVTKKRYQYYGSQLDRCKEIMNSQKNKNNLYS